MELCEYPQWKETGIDWLEEIPEHWEISKLKFMAIIQNGSDYKHVEVNENESGYPVYGSGGAFKKSSQYLYNGSSVFFGRKGTIDKPILVHGKFWTVDTMFYSEIHENTDCRFLYYSALTIQFQMLATQTALPSITQHDLSNYFLAFPVKSEQTQIAKFLDYKTAQIDRLIEKKKALIEKLGEKRIALITQAVTKGLNPDVPMKDSEVDWLGEVPEHWEVIRLGALGKFSSSGIDKKSNPNEPPVKIINYTDVYGNSKLVLDNQKKYMQVTTNQAKIDAHCIKKGDLIFTPSSETSEDIGLSAVVIEELSGTAFSYHVLRFVFNKYIDINYKKYLCNNTVVLNQFSRRAQGTTRQILNRDDFKSIFLRIPSNNEQTQIAKFLDYKTAQIDKLMNKTREAIDKLNEYRTALITAAVTGKIDVRNININTNKA